jgi:hypothetical protein
MIARFDFMSAGAGKQLKLVRASLSSNARGPMPREFVQSPSNRVLAFQPVDNPTRSLRMVAGDLEEYWRGEFEGAKRPSNDERANGHGAER